MKKRIIFIIISTLVLGSILSATVIQKDFKFDEPTINKIGNYDRISIDGLSYTYEPGYPELPALPVQIIIPAGEEAVNVEVSYTENESVIGSYNVYPRQKPYPISYKGEISFIKPEIETIIQKMSFIPAELVSEVTTQYLTWSLNSTS